MPRTFADATEMPERWAQALQLRAAGASLSKIGAALGVSKARARQIVEKGERRMRDLSARGLLALVIFIIGAAALPAFAATGIRVIDGDTIDVSGERVRILNIDTPERGKRARCEAERVMAERASRALRARIAAAGRVTLQRDGLDRYGRTLALVYADGRDVGEELIAQGLAVRWGNGRPDWCGG